MKKNLHPKTLEECIGACLEAIADPNNVFVIPGHALFVDIAHRIIALEEAANGKVHG